MKIVNKAGFIINEPSEDPLSVRRRLAGAKPYLRFLNYLPSMFVQEWVLPHMPLRKMHYATSDVITDAFGNQCIMEFWAVPRTGSQMLRDQPTDDIIQVGRYLEDLGCEIIGLGAQTAIVGDKGITVAQELKAGVTTGNSLTAVMGVKGALEAARRMGIVPGEVAAAVIGAGGSTGGASAKLLVPYVGELLLVGRTQPPLYRLQRELDHDRSRVVDDLDEALKQAQIIITVTSATQELNINPSYLLPGTVVCDVARPRDVARSVADARDDVLVIDGGTVSTRGAMLNGNFGMAPATAYACMAETFVLSLAKMTGDYSLGADLEMEKVLQIGRLAEEHGFHLAGLRSFDRQVTDAMITGIRNRAEDRKRVLRRD